MGWLLIIKIDIRCSVKANNVEVGEKKKHKSNEFLRPTKNNVCWNPFNYINIMKFFLFPFGA